MREEHSRSDVAVAAEGRAITQTSTARHGPRRLWIGGVAAAMALGIFHSQILMGVAAFMSARDPLEPADYILLLYHEAHTVPFAAADLLHRGYANQVLLGQMRPSRLEALGLVPLRHELWRKVLVSEQVPPDAITVIGDQLEDDVELGHALGAYLRHRRETRVIAVASAPVSRRSRTDLRQGLAGTPVDLRMYPVPRREFDERTWWKSRHGLVSYFDAYYLWFVRFLRR